MRRSATVADSTRKWCQGFQIQQSTANAFLFVTTAIPVCPSRTTSENPKNLVPHAMHTFQLLNTRFTQTKIEGEDNSSRNPHVPISDYIGLSQRSCFACNAYIAAFNEVFVGEDRGGTIFRSKFGTWFVFRGLLRRSRLSQRTFIWIA